MEVIETSSPKEDAGKALGLLLKTHKHKPILLMLSGGSAFSILDFVPTVILGPTITISVLDERYSIDPQINNFAQLEQTDFFKVCLQHGANVISTKVLEGESFKELRYRFESALHEWKEQHKNGVVIATMGIGVDGHTAGMLVGNDEVDFNSDAWVVDYAVPVEVNAYTQRVTVTNTFLKKEVSAAIAFVVGTEKKKFIQKLRDEHCDITHYPACILREMTSVSVITEMLTSHD